MEVEFTYLVTGHEKWTELEAACERAVRLNSNFQGFAILPPSEEEDHGFVSLRSGGHDRTAITRRILAPIRSIFHRAGVSIDRIHLIEQRVVPNGRHKTLAEGRTPQGTFADGSLRQMLRDHASVEELPEG
jgi:hypothetical protein